MNTAGNMNRKDAKAAMGRGAGPMKFLPPHFPASSLRQLLRQGFGGQEGPAGRSDQMALSWASRRKQIPCSEQAARQARRWMQLGPEPMVIDATPTRNIHQVTVPATGPKKFVRFAIEEDIEIGQ
jgi:hypothetical protein